jgi:hypothetical protein
MESLSSSQSGSGKKFFCHSIGSTLEVLQFFPLYKARYLLHILSKKT